MLTFLCNPSTLLPLKHMNATALMLHKTQVLYQGSVDKRLETHSHVLTYYSLVRSCVMCCRGDGWLIMRSDNDTRVSVEELCGVTGCLCSK